MSLRIDSIRWKISIVDATASRTSTKTTQKKFYLGENNISKSFCRIINELNGKLVSMSHIPIWTAGLLIEFPILPSQLSTRIDNCLEHIFIRCVMHSLRFKNRCLNSGSFASDD